MRGGQMTRVLVLNGPNLARLGSREPDVYGPLDYAALVALCRSIGAEVGMDIDVRQTDDEAELIGWIHGAIDERLPVIINPAAFTHYSYALRDACAQRTARMVEVHISNPAAREDFRHHSVVSAVVDGTIAGFGFDSYRLAIAQMARWAAEHHGAA